MKLHQTISCFLIITSSHFAVAQNASFLPTTPNIEDAKLLAMPFTGNEMQLGGAFTDLRNCKNIQWRDLTKRGVAKVEVSCELSDIDEISNNLAKQAKEYINKYQKEIDNEAKKHQELINEIETSLDEINKEVQKKKKNSNSTKKTAQELKAQAAENRRLAKTITTLSEKLETAKNNLKKVTDGKIPEYAQQQKVFYENFVNDVRLTKGRVVARFLMTVDHKTLKLEDLYTIFSLPSNMKIIHNHEYKDSGYYTYKDFIMDLYADNKLWNTNVPNKTFMQDWEIFTIFEKEYTKIQNK